MIMPIVKGDDKKAPPKKQSLKSRA